MGKLIAAIAAAGLLAGGASYGLVYHTGGGCPGHTEATCPVAKSACCAAPVSVESAPADACSGDAGSVACATGSDNGAALAVAGSAALFTSKVKKKACCCCCAEEPAALTAVVGVAALAAK